MKKYFLLLGGLMIVTMFSLMADTPPDPPFGSPDPVPVDGGITALAAAGLFAAARKFKATK